MGWVFVGFSPEHRCRVPGDPGGSPASYLEANNVSVLNSYDETGWIAGQCSRRNVSMNITESCLDGYIYLEVRFIDSWSLVSFLL